MATNARLQEPLKEEGMEEQKKPIRWAWVLGRGLLYPLGAEEAAVILLVRVRVRVRVRSGGSMGWTRGCGSFAL